MTSTPAEHVGAPPRESPQQSDPDGPARPELRVVPDVETTHPEPGPEPDLDPEVVDDGEDVDDGIAAEAPWQYQLGQTIAAMADALPGLWSQRPTSYAERVQYSLTGDWTTAPEGQSTKRTLHLIGVLACIAVDGLLVTPLRAATVKPSRLGVLLLVLLILAYAL